jgi:hypothetical protein
VPVPRQLGRAQSLFADWVGVWCGRTTLARIAFWEGAFWVNWATQFRVHIFGWLLTALAISLGAPFWFDLLNKFIVVRATVKPQEKSPEEKSKD